MDDREEALKRIARNITEEFFDVPRWEVGDIVDHPDGYPVKILSGMLWQEHPDGGQRLVNQWTWTQVDGSGNEIGPVHSGEGWVSDRAISPPSFGH